MSAWLLSIVGIICLGVLIEIVMPEGQMNKYVRGAFSLLVIFVVVAPLPSVFSGDYKFVFPNVQIETDEDFIASTAVRYDGAMEDDVENYLLLSGYEAEITIIDDEEKLSKIERIEVKLRLSVLDAETVNTHISRVRELVSDYTGVEGSKITVSTEEEYGSD